MEEERAKEQLKLLFAARVVLWVTALVATVYWIVYSFKLSADEIFDPYEYSTLLRPVLYKGLGIAIAAVCISFYLFHLSRKIKAKYKIR